MATVKLECPECGAVLKPAKAPEPGKRVKCPKCGEPFTVPDDEDDEEEAPPRKKPAKPATKPAAKKTKPPAAKAPEPKAAESKKADDDDEEGGTYTLAEGGGTKQDEPEINYAPDESIKDPRGPAAAALVAPSNALIWNGVLGFLGWLFMLIVVLVPIIFPLEDPETMKNKSDGKTGRSFGTAVAAIAEDDPAWRHLEFKPGDKPPEPISKIFGVDFALIATFTTPAFLACLPIFAMGMGYGFLIAVSGVKMQSLESWNWAVAGCIMTMIPFHTFGLMVMSCVVLQLGLGAVFDDPGSRDFGLIVSIILEEVGMIVLGGWGLRLLFKPDIKAGFEYKSK